MSYQVTKVKCFTRCNNYEECLGVYYFVDPDDITKYTPGPRCIGLKHPDEFGSPKQSGRVSSGPLGVAQSYMKREGVDPDASTPMPDASELVAGGVSDDEAAAGYAAGVGGNTDGGAPNPVDAVVMPVMVIILSIALVGGVVYARRREVNRDQQVSAVKGGYGAASPAGISRAPSDVSSRFFSSPRPGAREVQQGRQSSTPMAPSPQYDDDASIFQADNEYFEVSPTAAGLSLRSIASPTSTPRKGSYVAAVDHNDANDSMLTERDPNESVLSATNSFGGGEKPSMFVHSPGKRTGRSGIRSDV